MPIRPDVNLRTTKAMIQRRGEQSRAPEYASRAVLKWKIFRAYRVTRTDYEVRGLTRGVWPLFWDLAYMVSWSLAVRSER